MSKKKEKKKSKERLKPISLYPLEPEDALNDILKIIPKSDNIKNGGGKRSDSLSKRKNR